MFYARGNVPTVSNSFIFRFFFLHRIIPVFFHTPLLFDEYKWRRALASKETFVAVYSRMVQKKKISTAKKET